MERRVAELEHQARESDERARQLTDDKALLQQELKTTQRDLSKLDAFKRSIIQSIHEEDVPAGLGGMPPVFSGGAPPPSTDFTPAAAPTPYSPAPPPSGSAGAFMSAAGGTVRSPVQPSSPGETNAAAVMDGKDFFRQARLRLTYEQFNQFLSNIKRLNDHAQTRDETLARAQEIFGAENGDLFASFKTLLSKHGLT